MFFTLGISKSTQNHLLEGWGTLIGGHDGPNIIHSPNMDIFPAPRFYKPVPLIQKPHDGN